MHEMTESNLKDAFAGESQAWMRYKTYEEIAESQNYYNVARLFRAISFAEKVHARNHLTRLPESTGPSTGHSPYGIRTTKENLQKGIDGELYEIEEMYPSFIAVAEEQEEQEALTSFKYALKAEEKHAEKYKEAKEAVEKEETYDLDDVQICSVCGYTTEGEAPENCPICGASKDKFKTFEK
ncbi:MAG: Rubrerythrin [Candidatus Methanohalarchaeum thermophilum]|uniref:Rubrerythrin n=1 Tax=Methanohalarchaeum thermophilum TaxID=1903181 RepID=A0A1Q6DVM3_METT1|nr:MAG: Rubrerythrin [Candidatus Methanohalarchaeum thermophilum]